MSVITIPKKAAKEDLVVIPRKEYEELLTFRKLREFTPTVTIRKALKRSERNLRSGKTLSYDDLRRQLGFTN
ncbi:hypothetical protein HY504_01415 [Candidatus Wolfebacteria bacterium]|nr:hypothetical protein [Candidatus Wolfebacteria bacterium]